MATLTLSPTYVMRPYSGSDPLDIQVIVSIPEEPPGYFGLLYWRMMEEVFGYNHSGSAAFSLDGSKKAVIIVPVQSGWIELGSEFDGCVYLHNRIEFWVENEINRWETRATFGLFGPTGATHGMDQFGLSQ